MSVSGPFLLVLLWRKLLRDPATQLQNRTQFESDNNQKALQLGIKVFSTKTNSVRTRTAVKHAQNFMQNN